MDNIQVSHLFIRILHTENAYLWDFEGGQAYAQFSKFSISDSSDFYRLSIDGYSGTAGDSMKYHNGMRFSTKDQDHDNWGSNCAESRRGAWWYSSCAKSNLNGFYYEKGESQDPIYSGVLWDTWKNDYRSLRQVEMKIRNQTTEATETSTTMKPTTEELSTEQPTTCSSGRPKNCAEIQGEELGFNSSRNCMIYPFGPEGDAVEVFCDFETDGGGWTIIQKRSSGPKLEFYRNWTDYEAGFGSVDGNYWLGLKAIHALTKDRDQELRIDLWDFEGDQAYAKYSNFYTSDSSDYYRLSIGGYSGTARDSINAGGTVSSNGMRFSTKDKDNDNWHYNCIEDQYKGAWWHNLCSRTNLNGLYLENGEKPDPFNSAIMWIDWKNSKNPMRQTEMKIRQRR